jgi:hypothetical protein
MGSPIDVHINDAFDSTDFLESFGFGFLFCLDPPNKWRILQNAGKLYDEVKHHVTFTIIIRSSSLPTCQPAYPSAETHTMQDSNITMTDMALCSSRQCTKGGASLRILHATQPRLLR